MPGDIHIGGINMKTIIMQRTFPLLGETKLREFLERGYQLKESKTCQYLIKEEDETIKK